MPNMATESTSARNLVFTDSVVTEIGISGGTDRGVGRCPLPFERHQERGERFSELGFRTAKARMRGVIVVIPF
jgi:hypothetical protein